MKLNLALFKRSDLKNRIMGFRTTLICMLVVGIQCRLMAQEPDSSMGKNAMQPREAKPVSPAQKAANQIKNLQEKLALSKSQVQDIYMILLKRDVQLDSLKNYPPNSRKDERKMRRDINQTADQQMEALLTLDQVQKFEELKAQQREKMKEKRNQAGGAAAQ